LSRNKSTNFRRIFRHFNKFLQENTSVFFNQFKTFNLDFFHLDALNNYELSNIIFAYKKKIYRKIFIFVKRINNYVYVVNEVVI